MTGFELWTICTTITAPMYVVGILVIFYLLNKGQCLCVFVCVFVLYRNPNRWMDCNEICSPKRRLPDIKKGK